MSAGAWAFSDLPESWIEPSAFECDHLVRELARETPFSHVLRGQRVEIRAVRKQLKDMLCWLPAEDRWAWVHLTWRVESDPRWPSVEFADTWKELVLLLKDADGQ